MVVQYCTHGVTRYAHIRPTSTLIDDAPLLEAKEGFVTSQVNKYLDGFPTSTVSKINSKLIMMMRAI